MKAESKGVPDLARERHGATPGNGEVGKKDLTYIICIMYVYYCIFTISIS